MISLWYDDKDCILIYNYGIATNLIMLSKKNYFIYNLLYFKQINCSSSGIKCYACESFVYIWHLRNLNFIFTQSLYRLM